MVEQTLPENRWQTIQDIWKGNQWLFVIIGYFIGLLTFPALQDLINNLSDLLSGFVPEAVGIGVTVLFIDRLNRRRDENRRVEDLKARLVREAGSSVNSVAVNAIEELHAKDWLRGRSGLLKSGYLYETDLRGAHLVGANLSSTNLVRANLSEARLWQADMRDANLFGANLASADLSLADLQRSDLNYVDLRKTNLAGTNLRETKISNAVFDENTVLPDAKLDTIQKEQYDKYWTPETDMTRYTDPHHPDFWQPYWVNKRYD